MLKENKFLTTISLFLFIVLIASCGGGGGGGDGDGDGDGKDITPPTVLLLNPSNNESGVAVNTLITATFSEKIDASTINAGSFYIVGIASALSYFDKTVVFTPTSNLNYSTAYTVVITTDVKDMAGNPLSENYVWSFTTISEGSVSGSLYVFLAEDCSYEQPDLWVSGILKFGEYLCGISSIDISGGLSEDGTFYMASGQGPVTVGFTAYNFSSSLINGTYNIYSPYPSCYITGNFSMNKVSGEDSCGGMSGNWSGNLT